jgi:2-keto-4-pentenoate hydratase
LRKGDVVLSGALGPMAALAPGDHIRAAIGGLGTVSFSFEG